MFSWLTSQVHSLPYAMLAIVPAPGDEVVMARVAEIDRVMRLKARDPRTVDDCQGPMTKSYREITRSVSSSLAKLRSDTPDVLKAFNALAEAALREGALTRKTKALGVAVYMGGGPSLMAAADALAAFEELQAPA